MLSNPDSLNDNGDSEEGKTFDLSPTNSTEVFLDFIRSTPGHAQAILAAIPDLLFIVSHEGYFLSGHARDESELLIPQASFIGKAIREVLPPEVAEGFDGAIQRIIRGEKLVSFSYSLMFHDEPHDFHARITPVDDSCVVVVARDVTEREQALRASERSAALLEQAGEIASIGAMSYDVERDLLNFSAVAAQIFNLEPSNEITLEQFLSVLPDGADRESISDRFQNLINHGGEIDEVCQFKRPDFSKVWVRCSIRTEMRDGKVIRLYGPVHDITLQKQTEARIDAMLSAVQQHNQRLTNFAHIVSHNLKSHAANLSALTHMLSEEGFNAAQSRTFTYLEQATHNLNQTVAHLAEVARSNMFDAEKRKSLNLREAITKAFESIQALAVRSDVELINDVDATIVVFAFDEYLDSIVLNLISNAIRYRSTERAAFVRASAQRTYNTVDLHIEDNGLGIDTVRNDSQLFELYKTFHHHPDARGIGLFITKSQVEAMGGSISVKSQPNLGSVFTVCWPQS